MNPMRTRLGSTPSDSHNILRARTLLMFVQFVFDLLAFLQRLETLGLDRRKMNKDVAAYRGIDDKPKSLLLVEPLYYSSGHTLLIIFCASIEGAPRHLLLP